MLDWKRKLKRKSEQSALFERQVKVTDNGEFVAALFPSGELQIVDWSDLTKVEIHTNDSGPWGADVWWVLVGENGRCTYPQGGTGEVELISKLQDLPGFDNDVSLEQCVAQTIKGSCAGIAATQPNKSMQTDQIKLSRLVHAREPRQLALAADLGH